MFDLVCGMELLLADVAFTFAYAGEQYFFCSATCRDHLEADPHKYIGSNS